MRLLLCTYVLFILLYELDKVVKIWGIFLVFLDNHSFTLEQEYLESLAGYVKNQEYRNRERNVGNAGNRGNVIFQGMSPKILGNVLKHSWECRKTFRGMSENIPGSVRKHAGECPKTFLGMSPNIPENVTKLLLIKSTSKQLG